MTDKLSKCHLAEVTYSGFFSVFCSRCGKSCEVVEKQYIFDATKSADGYSNEPIEIQITPTVPTPQDRLLTGMEQTKALDAVPFADLRGRVTRDILCQAQDAKTSALVRAECQEENIRLVNEVCGLVTELRELKATHKKELEAVKSFLF